MKNSERKDGKLRCRLCGRGKPEEEFYRRPGGRFSACKKCVCETRRSKRIAEASSDRDAHPILARRLLDEKLVARGMTPKRTCGRCWRPKPLACFPFRGGLPLTRCRRCEAAAEREYRAKLSPEDKDEIREREMARRHAQYDREPGQHPYYENKVRERKAREKARREGTDDSGLLFCIACRKLWNVRMFQVRSHEPTGRARRCKRCMFRKR